VASSWLAEEVALATQTYGMSPVLHRDPNFKC